MQSTTNIQQVLFYDTPPDEFWEQLQKQYDFSEVIHQWGYDTAPNIALCFEEISKSGYYVDPYDVAKHLASKLWMTQNAIIRLFTEHLEDNS